MHGAPLSPGPGAVTVLIGNMPAWRAVPAAAGQALTQAKQVSDQTLAILAQATVTAAAVVPPAGLPVAQAAEVAGRTAALAAMGSAISAMAASGADIHNCVMPFAALPPDMAPSPCPPGPGHGPGWSSMGRLL